MTLQELADLLRRHDLVVSAPEQNPAIAGLAVHTREVGPGSLYLAIRGVADDGHRFVPQAIAAGAVAVIGDQVTECSVPFLQVRDARLAAQVLAEAWHRHPAAALRLIGVTGTNGKTTTTALARHLLDREGTTGSLGTIGAWDGKGARVETGPGDLTTPGPLDLQAILARMVEAGVGTVVMEASSHALDQGRLDRIAFAAGAFTNLTRDHLDYHRTMDAYRSAKLRLADLVAEDGVLAVNADEPAWAVLHRDRRLLSWGRSPDAAVRADDVHPLPTGSRFTLAGRFGSAPVTLPLPGEFNVSNALAAAAIALGVGVPFDEVVERLATAPQVPGRLERIVDAPFAVLRDYAHTPDALERALAALRVITPRHLIVVFGCGGDRDRGKRPQMGQVAVAGADRVYITSDNPRTEDPDRIIDDIVAGLRPGSYERETDRHIAIAMAIGSAGPGDTVLLAGKGHETYQINGTVKTPFDERDIVLGLLGR